MLARNDFALTPVHGDKAVDGRRGRSESGMRLPGCGRRTPRPGGSPAP